jgi:EAL domain-containing protein (putative c-di-GMP-specific phosphodiesterase class I)
VAAPRGKLSALVPTRSLRAPSLIVGFSALLTIALAGLALLLGSHLRQNVVDEHQRGAETTARVFTAVTMHDSYFKGGRLKPGVARQLTNAVADAGDVSGLRVFDLRHRVLYGYTAEQRETGEVPSDEFVEATRGEVASEITNEEAERAEHEGNASFENGTQIEVYVPIRRAGEAQPHAVAETYLPYEVLRHKIASATRRLYVILGTAAILLYLALFPTLMRTSRILTEYYERQNPSLQRRVRRAMRNNELIVHYQPKLDLRRGRITGVEALLRWRRRGRLVPPSEFLSHIEQTEVMKPLTLHVIELALKQVAQWERAGLSLGVAINLSPANIADENLPAELARLVQRYEVLPEQLTLEITETAMMSDPERAARIMKTLGGLGFRLSIDDFGTGQSNLSRLDQLPFRELKIDISLIRALAAGGDDTLVKSIVGLAHQLELWVVAEGVESDYARECLSELGCDVAQGFLVSHPVEAERIVDLVQDYDFRSRAESAPSDAASTLHAAGL